MQTNKNSPLPESETRSLAIGQLAREFGLSRSTLLYYDRIGLLRPSGRSRANYRRYTEEDRRRLRLVCMYRQVGLSMAAIGRIIESPQSGVRDILEKRLLELGREISGLREQQQVIIRMLGDSSLRASLPVMDKESWVSLMRATGLDDEAMERWHKEFEKLSPLLHQEFLEGLGISKEEIASIREWSRS
ncbi:MAG: MerR family transcriptional regulator [Syntrophales bacterium]|nr:MerR family transcriptional regulator [Syntrophales bacterium]